MNDEQYLMYARQIFADFTHSLVKRTENLPQDDPLRELAATFLTVSENPGRLYTDGPGAILRLFVAFPDFAPAIPRELLWFFGGDCLHFMPDDEIEVYQQLDELRVQAATRGELFDPQAARAKLLKLQ